MTVMHVRSTFSTLRTGGASCGKPVIASVIVSRGCTALLDWGSGADCAVLPEPCLTADQQENCVLACCGVSKRHALNLFAGFTL